MRGKFEFNGGEAVIRTSAPMEYAVFINGRRIFCGLVKAFSFHRYYDETEITDCLLHGENTICILSFDGSAVAEVICGRETVFETDETWKIKKYDAIECKTAHLCAPLEPQRRFEEHFNAVMDKGIEGRSYDDSEWNYAEILFEAEATENFAGKASGNMSYAKEIISILGAEFPKGFGFRLFNEKRQINPVSKMCMEVCGISVISECDFTAEVRCLETSFFVNGEEVSDFASFKKGENFILAINSGYVPEMFIYANGLTITDCVVESFETSEKCFAWAYPHLPFEGTDTEQRLSQTKKVCNYSEFLKMKPIQSFREM